MWMALFQVGGHDYRSDPLDALTQFHVSRRLSPVVLALAPLIGLGATVQELSSVITADIGQNLRILQPAIEAVAKMPDEDVNYVISKTMARVYRAIKNPSTGAVDSWIPVWSPTAGVLQYEDIGMVEMIQIVWNVLRESLSGFFSGNPSSSST
jgi:hypothetical protein